MIFERYTVYDALKVALCKPTLLEALTWMAVWESERVVHQARNNPTWETCFEYCFKLVLEQWKPLEPPENRVSYMWGDTPPPYTKCVLATRCPPR